MKEIANRDPKGISLRNVFRNILWKDKNATDFWY